MRESGDSSLAEGLPFEKMKSKKGVMCMRKSFLRWLGKIGFGALLVFLGIKIGAQGYILPSPKIYISDFWNNRVVRINDIEGKDFIALGNKGHDQGQFFSPRSIALDSKGWIYVVDSDNNRIIRMDDIYGHGWTAYGHQGKGVGEFWTPTGIAVDRSGRIYIADFGNDRIVRFDDMKGTNWVSWGIHGAGIGELAGPFSIAVY